jgi:sporulation protein YlmC with PRC-barrel domain
MYERVPEQSDERSQEFLRSNNLVPLKQLDEWDVAEGETDIRGWDIVDRDDNKIGKVDDLLINMDLKQATFAIVSYGGTLGFGTKQTAVPLDQTDLDMDDREVVFRGLANDVTGAPQYDKDIEDFSSIYDYWSKFGFLPGRRQLLPQVNIKGWTLVDRNNIDIGIVEEMVTNTTAGREHLALVRYGDLKDVVGTRTLIPFSFLDIEFLLMFSQCCTDSLKWCISPFKRIQTPIKQKLTAADNHYPAAH